jgi:2-hydroxy-6-oxonona-2,4-dienedioate hydrolase
MRTIETTASKRLLIAGAIVGAAVVWRAAANKRARRHRLARGEIRPVQSQWTQVGEWRMHARIALPPHPSDLPPVVLIHGFGVSSAYFVPTAERLGTLFNVYAPDLPGHGKSDTPHEPLDVLRLTDALIAWMDAMQIERACLLGNSMGCQIAVDAALRYPARVDRLVLVGLTTDPKGRTTGQLIKRFLAGGAYERLALNWVLARDYGRMGRRLLREFRFMQWDPIEVKLPDIEVPTMLVRGENDSIVPQRWLDEAGQLLGTDRKAVIPRAGHAVNFSAADELVTAVAPFLATRASYLAKGQRDTRAQPEF